MEYQDVSHKKLIELHGQARERIRELESFLTSARRERDEARKRTEHALKALELNDRATREYQDKWLATAVARDAAEARAERYRVALEKVARIAIAMGAPHSESAKVARAALSGPDEPRAERYAQAAGLIEKWAEEDEFAGDMSPEPVDEPLKLRHDISPDTSHKDATQGLCHTPGDTEAIARSILARVAEYGPPQGELQASTACAFCDMGGAGYSSRGDGYHDDNCAVKDAQLFLAALALRAPAGTEG